MSLLKEIMMAWQNRSKLRVVADQALTVQAAIKSAPTTGYLSSEFLTTVITAGVIIYNAFVTKQIDPATASVVAGAIVAMYTGFRTLLKTAHQVVSMFHVDTIVNATPQPPAPPPPTTPS